MTTAACAAPSPNPLTYEALPQELLGLRGVCLRALPLASHAGRPEAAEVDSPLRAGRRILDHQAIA